MILIATEGGIFVFAYISKLNCHEGYVCVDGALISKNLSIIYLFAHISKTVIEVMTVCIALQGRQIIFCT